MAIPLESSGMLIPATDLASLLSLNLAGMALSWKFSHFLRNFPFIKTLF
jgi:hypothetical protein